MKVVVWLGWWLLACCGAASLLSAFCVILTLVEPPELGLTLGVPNYLALAVMWGVPGAFALDHGVRQAVAARPFRSSAVSREQR